MIAIIMALVKVLAPVLLAALHETVRSFGCCVAFHTVSFHNPPLKKTAISIRLAGCDTIRFRSLWHCARNICQMLIGYVKI